MSTFNKGSTHIFYKKKSKIAYAKVYTKILLLY